jgi:hypothetical protein
MASAAKRQTRRSEVVVRLPGGVEVTGQGSGREQAFWAVLAQCPAPTEEVRYGLTEAGWRLVTRQRRGVA